MYFLQHQFFFQIPPWTYMWRFRIQQCFPKKRLRQLFFAYGLTFPISVVLCFFVIVWFIEDKLCFIFCTDSNLFMFLFVWGFPILEQFSNFGLELLVYALSFTLGGQCFRFRFKRKTRTLDAFLQVWLMCRLYFMLLHSSTTRYGWWLTFQDFHLSFYRWNQSLIFCFQPALLRI